MNNVRIHQAGCATAKKDRVQYSASRKDLDAVNLGQIRHQPLILIDLAADVGIEITVRAFCLTEWPMNIKTKTASLPVGYQVTFNQNTPLLICETHPHGG